MPLVASWIDIANIHWQHIRGDMHIEFHTTPARISGAGNITLQNMDIILSSQIPTTLDMKQMPDLPLMAPYAHINIYLGKFKHFPVCHSLPATKQN